MTFPIHKIPQTGNELDNILDLSDEFIKGYAFGGVITPSDVPIFEPQVKAVYIATIPGTYNNFDGVTVTGNSFIAYDGISYTVVPFGGTGSIAGVASVNNDAGPVVTLTTDDIPEGVINKYFTGTIPVDINELTDVDSIISNKANKTEVLIKGNITPFTPSLDYDPSTKIYVDNIVSTLMSKIVYDSNDDGSVDVADLAKEVDWNTASLPPYELPSSIATHIDNTTIHFTEDSINKYTKEEINDLIDILQLDINNNTNRIDNLDSASEDTVLSHIYNLSVHFTKADALNYFLENINIDNIDDAVLTNTIGNRIYTEQNYITNSETITASLDALDINVNAHNSNTDIHFELSDIIVECSGAEII